jgi:anionic cell wall polymer biosynthesis LytR-Cps2A-Psr (LCP) family protein
MATNNHAASEIFGQATRSFESAIQTGLKLQEDSVRFMTDMLNDIGSPQKWQQKTQAVMNEIISSSQKNMDEAVQVMNENAKTSMDLLQKAFQSRPADTNEAQSRTLELWESTLGIVRRNSEAALRANTRIVEAWTEMAKKVNGEQMERMAEMAQRATQAASGAAQGH